MRITSRLLSLRLCAFSVLSARMRYASDSSGETSAVICRRPSTFAAARRWRPFGVHRPPSAPRTTISGSRKAPASSIFAARRLVCVGDRSRWNGVGCTAVSGSDATTSGRPPSGSRYAPSAAPPAAFICAASEATSGSSSGSATSVAASPRRSRAGASLPRARRAAPFAGRGLDFRRAGIRAVCAIPSSCATRPHQCRFQFRRLQPMKSWSAA